MRTYLLFKYGFSGAVILWLSVLTLEAKLIRVATLNLYNYVITNRMVGSVYRKDYPKPEDEKEALREVVIKTEPDILAIQEIGPKPYLLEFQRDLRSDGIDYPYIILMEAVDKDRHTGILSKLPFDQVKRHDNLEFKWFNERLKVKCGLLEIIFESENLQWSLFNLHLKSRYTVHEEDPEGRIQREGEATVIRNYIKKNYIQNSNLHYLIVGDFNDTIGSKTLRRLLKSGSTKIADPVSARDSRGETWTYYYKKEDVYSRFDYILSSPEMVPYIESASGTIVDIPAMKRASDHRLVYVDIIIQEE